MRRLALVTLLVRDYDEAIAHYVGVLGFELVEDTPMEGGKRWVVVAPAGSTGCALLLARATTETQVARVGDQTGGRVALFLHTDDIRGDHRRWSAAGIRFDGPLRVEPYGTVAIFTDLYGNRWDLIEPAAPQD